MKTMIAKRKVVLIGAGPGDPELITLKGMKYLEQADVVISDRLVSPLLWARMKPGSKLILAGKEGGNPHSTPQPLINDWLVEHAIPGNLVVRLKGGDVSFFSNVFDELDILTRNQIPYEIVPGVTAASGASASAGFPLTARGYASSVRFLTYSKPDQVDRITIKEWAETDDTLVYYMSSSELNNLLSRIKDLSVPSDKWVAAIEQATTSGQRIHCYSIDQFISKMKGYQFTSPTIVVIGRVVQLFNRFGKTQEQVVSDTYFPSFVKLSSTFDQLVAC